MNKHALITGSSSGIGKAIALYLLAQGWQITGISRHQGSISHPNFHFLAADLADTQALSMLLPQLPKSLNAFIHSAGMMVAANLGTLDPNLGQKLWQLHVHSAATIANHLLLNLQPPSRIILIGSRSAKGMAGRSQYAACKAALVAMAKSWAAELVQQHITVNVIAPAATDTEMLRAPNRSQSLPRLPPLGRYIYPEEIAALTAYLLSPEAAAITGQEITICGGASLIN